MTDETIAVKTPREEILGRLQQMKLSLDDGIAYRLESIFAKTTGWGANGEIKRRTKLIKQVEPTLKQMLLPSEEVLYVAKGVQYSFAESYLMGALQNTIVQRQRWNTRQKRGHGVPDLNLDDIPEPVVLEDERRFDTAWAERVLEMALDALERDMTESGRGAEFSALARFLGASADGASSCMVAEELGLSAPALRSKIFRLRQQFREGILAEISRTVETPHEAEQEMAYLFEVVSQPGFSLAAICETAEPL